MIIDCHGHYTTEPKDLHRFRKDQTEAVKNKTPLPPRAGLKMSDDEIRSSIEGAQLKLQRERGTDLTIFSPRASGMGHHIGDFAVSKEWTEVCNDLVHRVCNLFPKNFIGVCQLPQTQGESPTSSIKELERCVKELGMVGCNLNPDPSGGYFNAPPLTDKWWYPFYEKMIELDVPAMIHVSGCCNPAQHTTGSYYLNADTMAVMQLILSDVFKDFPKLKLIIPHGGGAVPYHWGRFRGIALDNKRPELAEIMGNNIFFDTCVYHQPGIDLLTKVVPVDNILFASEMVGAVKGIDPDTGNNFDDTKRYVDGSSSLRRRQAEDLRGQRLQGLSAAQGADRQAGARPQPRLVWIVSMATMQRAGSTIVGFALLLGQCLTAHGMEARVIVATPMKAATTELAAQFERATGNKIVVESAAAPSIKKMIDGGAKFDAIILASEFFKELSEQGKIEPGTATPVARVGIGIAIRAGAPRPDIGSIDALKNSLKAAKRSASPILRAARLAA